jgi:hypothetical protein
VFGIEVNEGFRRLWIPPYLSKHSYIDSTHQLLTENIETVSCIMVRQRSRAVSIEELTDVVF